jgi:hypothetical protein
MKKEEAMSDSLHGKRGSPKRAVAPSEPNSQQAGPNLGIHKVKLGREWRGVRYSLHTNKHLQYKG